MDNIKILILIIIILLLILVITLLSNSYSMESLDNITNPSGITIESGEKITFELENFIKKHTNNDNNFILADKSLEFNILKDPSSISVDNSNKYLIYNSNKNNILLVGSIDISGSKNNEKAYMIIVLKNIYIVQDASGTYDPNFTVNSYIINNINSTQFKFDNGNLIINSVDNSGNNVIINKTNEISGPNTIFNIDDNGFNVLNTSTLNKKQLISFDELQQTLRPCYTQHNKQNTKQIIGLFVYLLQTHKP